MFCNTTCQALVGQYILILLIPFFIILSLTVGIRELVIRLMLSRSGVKVIGRITDHHKSSDWRNRKYYLRYDYHYNGSTYSREEKVPSYIYEGWDTGVRVNVSCLPTHPKTARLAYKIPASTAGKVGAAALLLIGIVVLIIILAIVIMFILPGNTGLLLF